MKAIRKYGTCFFEQYAQIALSALVSREFDTLVNKDRPDLQSKDGHSIGIEVTRAMEESRTQNAINMLKTVKSLTFRLFTDKENAQNHCNVGNGKIVLDTICNWIQSIDAEAMER